MTQWAETLAFKPGDLKSILRLRVVSWMLQTEPKPSASATSTLTTEQSLQSLVAVGFFFSNHKNFLIATKAHNYESLSKTQSITQIFGALLFVRFVLNILYSLRFIYLTVMCTMSGWATFMYVPSEHTWLLWKPEERVHFTRTEVTDSYEQSCECWEQNLGPLQEQQVLLCMEPSLQPLPPTSPIPSF